MRIAFHAPRAAYLKSYTSGDTANVQNFVAGLVSLGHEVKIVSNLNVRRLWQGRLSVWRVATEAIRVRREMRTFSPHAWLVYNSSITDADLFGWWQCRGRYVLINTRVGQGRRLPALWRRLFRFAHWRSLARADKLAADRPAHTEALVRAGVRAERVALLPSPAGGLGELPSQHEARARLSLPDDRPVILCVTRLPPIGWGAGKTERVLDLLASFATLPEGCLLVVVGDGAGRSHVVETIERLGITERVRLAGSVPHDEVRWYYSACDFYAYPFAADLPFVAIVEAQLAGRPVVAMRTSSMETIVADGRSGLLAADLEDFAKHMAALAGDRERCASMGSAAAEYASVHHSIDIRVRQIEALLLGRTGEGSQSRGDAGR